MVYRPAKLTPEQLEAGYHRSYRDFYSWRNVATASWTHARRAEDRRRGLRHSVNHAAYALGWKKSEPLWDLVIRARRLALMTPLLEGVLSSRGLPQVRHQPVQRGKPVAPERRDQHPRLVRVRRHQQDPGQGPPGVVDDEFYDLPVQR